MLRYVPGRSSDRRRGRSSKHPNENGTRTTSNALHVPAGRPLIYEPQRVGSERIGLEELDGLLQIEAEASGIGQGNRGWKQVFECEGSVLEQWEPGPDDAESELVFFRAMLPLEGVPLDVSLAQMFDPVLRQRWDSQIGSARCVPSVKARTNSDDVQSDVVHFQTESLLGVFPVGECIMWRSLMKRDGGSMAAFLLRNAEIDVNTGEVVKDVDSSWSSMVGPVRVRKLVYGHVFRSLDKTDESKGSRVFTYIQVKANTALQYAAPHLAESLAIGSRKEYRKACFAAMTRMKPKLPKEINEVCEPDDTEFYDIGSPTKKSEPPVVDFLGGVLGKVAPQDQHLRKKISRKEARKSSGRSTMHAHAPLRVVQLHRKNDEEIVQTEQSPPEVTNDSSDRRNRTQRLRERGRAMRQDSMAEMSQRLTAVMHRRGSAETEDASEGVSTINSDSMAWFSNLVDLRMSSVPETATDTVEQNDNRGQVVSGGKVNDGKESCGTLDQDGPLKTATMPESPMAPMAGDGCWGVQLTEISAPEISKLAVGKEIAQGAENLDVPAGSPVQDIGSPCDASVLSPGSSAATSPTPSLTSPVASTPRKKFTLPRMKKPAMPKIVERGPSSRRPSSSSSVSSSTASRLMPQAATAHRRDLSPSASTVSSPRSSCYDIFTGESSRPLAQEISETQHVVTEQALLPEKKIMDPINEDLAIETYKFVEDWSKKDYEVCTDEIPRQAMGPEPEPGPEPFPDSPSPKRRSRLTSGESEAPEIFDMTYADSDLPSQDEQSPLKFRPSPRTNKTSPSSDVRCSIKAQLGGGTLAMARTEETATTTASDAMLFCSVKEVATVAGVVNKIKAKSKSKREKSRRLRRSERAVDAQVLESV